MKKFLGIALLVLGTGFGTAHADNSKSEKVDVKRNVVRIVVKENPVKIDYSNTNKRHLIRVYGAQNSTGKVIAPKQETTQMPNLFNR